MTRREFSKKTRRLALERAEGMCEVCGAPLRPGQYEFDHELEAFMGGDNSLENCVVKCKTCHDTKTQERRPVIDKTRRMAMKHAGTWPKSKAKIPSRPFQNTRRI